MIMIIVGKVNLLGLIQLQLEQFFEFIGEKCFWVGQVMKWIYYFGVDDFDVMINVGKVLCEKFKVLVEICGFEIVSQDIFVDGICKWVVWVVFGSCVEIVYIFQGGCGILCVFFQVGCVLDCSFCFIGKQGFNSDFIVVEVIGQVWIVNKLFGIVLVKIDCVIINVVMMGMGELLLNFDNVVVVMNIMMDDFGYGIFKCKVILFIFGVVLMIDKFGEVIDVFLVLLLYVLNDELCNKLVLINKKYLLGMLLDVCCWYIFWFGEKCVLIVEYILFKDVNDQFEYVEQMIVLLKDMFCKINLILFNLFLYFGYECLSNNVIWCFQDMLYKGGFNVIVCIICGDDIDVVCG